MGAVPGTMGMALPTFVGMWALMMAAMMLPSVWPFVTTYSRTVRSHRSTRLFALSGGYLATWAAAGVVAYGLAWCFGELAAANRAWHRSSLWPSQRAASTSSRR